MSGELDNILNKINVYSKQKEGLELDPFIKKYLSYLQTIENLQKAKNDAKWLYFKQIFLSTTNGLNLLLDKFLSDDDKLNLICAERRFNGKIKINKRMSLLSKYNYRNNIYKYLKSCTYINFEYAHIKHTAFIFNNLNKKFPLEIDIPTDTIIRNKYLNEFHQFDNITMFIKLKIETILHDVYKLPDPLDDKNINHENINYLINFIKNNAISIDIYISADYDHLEINYGYANADILANFLSATGANLSRYIKRKN